MLITWTRSQQIVNEKKIRNKLGLEFDLNSNEISKF
jgi:hypothetical protein